MLAETAAPDGEGEAPAPASLMLPRLDGLSPRLLPPQEPSADGGPGPSRAHGSGLVITTRQQRRPMPKAVRKAMRHLWRTDVKRWCEAQDKHVEMFAHDQREEQEITAWFNALDIDGSGTVEEDEVRAMCNAMGVEINNAKLTRMFAAVDRPIDASLTKSEFVHFMNVNADLLAPSSFVGGGGGGGHRSLFDANTKLMMLAYRRQRLIDDMEDPVRRRNFAASLAALAPQPPPPADDDASSVLPHRMALLPAARAEAAAARRSPRRLVPSPRPPSTMLVPMPPSGLVSSLVPGNATMRRVPPPPHSPRALPPISPRSLSEEQGVPRPADACPTWEGAGAEAAAEAAVEAAAEAAAEAMDRGTEGALSIPARNLA